MLPVAFTFRGEAKKPAGAGARGAAAGSMAPLCWEEAADLARDGSEERLARLKRTDSALARYRAHTAQIEEAWRDPSDFVLHKVFGAAAQPEQGGSGRQKVGLDEEVRLAAGGRVAWAPNDFPYDLEPGIGHFLVWSIKPLTKREVEDVARREAPGRDFVTFVNPPGLRSVHRVWHAHVLVRAPPSPP